MYMIIKRHFYSVYARLDDYAKGNKSGPETFNSAERTIVRLPKIISQNS
jgi:hypothetical protein